MRGVIYFDSKYGTTETIAHWIQDEITNAQIDMIQIDENLMVDNSYHIIILGTPIYIGKPRQEFINFVMRNKYRFPDKVCLFIVTWASSTIYKEKTKNFIELIEFYMQPTVFALTVSLPGKLYLDKVSPRDKESMRRILHRLDLLSDEFESKNIDFNNQMNEGKSRQFGKQINEWIRI